MNKNSDDPKKVSWLPSWSIVLLILCIYSISIILLCWLFPNVGERGQFGDSFGAVNALFAGLAFAGVIWAIFLQKQELELQRQEFQRQNFESSFFQLLRFHSEIVNSMQFRSQNQRYSGRESLSQILLSLKSIYETPEEKFYTEMNGDSDEGRQDLLRRLNDRYEQFFTEHQSNIGYYFRNLYNVVKFVNEHDFPKEFKTKKFYTNLIRAQLSSDELVLLFYNCLSIRGENFKIFVERYALLEDMPLEDMPSEDMPQDMPLEKFIHKKLKELFYKKSAFGESD